MYILHTPAASVSCSICDSSQSFTEQEQVFQIDIVAEEPGQHYCREEGSAAHDIP